MQKHICRGSVDIEDLASGTAIEGCRRKNCYETGLQTL